MSLKYLNVQAALFVAGLCLVLGLGRLALLWGFGDPALWRTESEALVRLFEVGLRFDLRIAAGVLIPFYAFGLAAVFAPRLDAAFRIFRKIFIPAAVFTFVASAFVNYYYYQTYHSPIDIFIFGLVNDDTKAVVNIIFTDYPFLRVLLAAIIATCLLSFLIGLPARGKKASRRFSIMSALAALLVIAALVLGIRGSMGQYRLKRGVERVSSDQFINQLVPNAFLAFKWAVDDYENSERFEPVSLAEGRALMERALGAESLESVTPPNPGSAADPPHVVLALMEGMGGNLLRFDSRENDLLGALRPRFGREFVFSRFISDANVTISSLNRLLFSIPSQTITQGPAKNEKLAGSGFEPFKRAGYKVIFISSGNMGWQNTGAYITLMGADAVYDENDLVERYPEAASEKTAYGVPDAYAFRLAESLLEESAAPVFMVVLTVTNHSPYHPIAGYAPRPVALGADMAGVFAYDEAKSLEAMRVFQYSANALGEFVDRVESGPAARCIVAASGDHQMRGLHAGPTDLAWDRAVPFYLHVPEEILAATPYRFDAARPGSHKDIMPTLYALALSEARYYSVGGRNMLAPDDDPERAFGLNETLYIDAGGAYDVGNPDCRHAFTGDDYTVAPDCSPAVPGVPDKIRALQELWAWQLNFRVAGAR